MADYKTYKKQRYLYFWLSILCYFVPYVTATCALLPFMKADAGERVAIGLVVIFLNALPFVGGVMRSILAHFPFVNLLSIAFLALATFFTASIFKTYVSTFCTIELCAAIGSVAACIFWGLHMSYKRKAQALGSVIDSGYVNSVLESALKNNASSADENGETK